MDKFTSAMLINIFKIFFLSIILTSENTNGINITSCEPTYGPAGLCMGDNFCSGVLIGWHLPENIKRLDKCFIILKNNDLGTNETFEYTILERRNFNIIELNQLISNSSYSLIIKFTKEKYPSEFLFESEIKFNFIGVASASQDCQQSLSFVDLNTRGIGRLLWKVRSEFVKNLKAILNINIVISNSNNEQIQKNDDHVGYNETILDIKLKNLKENSSHQAMLTSSSWSSSSPFYISFLLFKTQEKYDYPLKPEDFQAVAMNKNTYSDSINVRFTWRRMDHVNFVIQTTNLRTGRVKETRDESLNLHPCTNYSVTLTAKFGANNSYSQSTIEFETLKRKPGYMYTSATVEGQNVTLKYEIKKTSCPPIGFRINATGISKWDDVVEQTEVQTIYEYQHTFVNLHPATDYTFTHIPFNELGIYESWHIINRKVVTADGVPTAVENVVVVQLSDGSTKIKWTPAKLTPGKVIKYWIEVSDSQTEQSLLLSSVRADTNQLNIQSVNFKDKYIFAAVWPQNSAANGTKVLSPQPFPYL